MLVMVGGGHTHALVLKKWIEKPQTRPKGKILLISQQATTPYGGMLSSVIQKRLPEAKMLIPIQHLCSRANVEFMQDVAIGLNLSAKEVYLGFRVCAKYDILSLNCGGYVPRISPRTSRSWVEKLERNPQPVVISGAGISGVETALALRVRFADRPIQLLERGLEIVPEVSPRLRQKVENLLRKKNIDLHLRSRSELPTDAFVINCLPTRAPRWLRASGLELAGDLVAIRPTLQTSDASVFGTGACTQFVKSTVPRAHVYSFREAPVLAVNLQRAMAEKSGFARVKTPSRQAFLMAVDREQAMLLRGNFSLGPSPIWMKMKDRIDRKFVETLERISE